MHKLRPRDTKLLDSGQVGSQHKTEAGIMCYWCLSLRDYAFIIEDNKIYIMLNL